MEESPESTSQKLEALRIASVCRLLGYPNFIDFWVALPCPALRDCWVVAFSEESLANVQERSFERSSAQLSVAECRRQETAGSGDPWSSLASMNKPRSEVTWGFLRFYRTHAKAGRDRGCFRFSDLPAFPQTREGTQMVLDENLAVLPGGFGRRGNNGRLFLRDKYLAE